MTFKILLNAAHNEWVGWFGDNVMKVRLAADSQQMTGCFQDFLFEDLGIKTEQYSIVKSDIKNRTILIEIPDVAWELFLTAIEK